MGVFKKYRYAISVFLLVVAGGALRFYRFTTNILLWTDSARDYLVGRHIVHYQEFPLVGHIASGIHGLFFYPPYYYYIIAFLVFIRDSLFFVTGFFILIHTFSIMFVYFLGKELCGRRVGLMACLFYTISSQAIYMSRLLLSASVTLPIYLLALWLFCAGLTRNKAPLLFISLLLLLFAGTIFYANLVIFLICVVVGLIYFKKKTTLVYVLLVVSGVAVWLFSPLWNTFGAGYFIQKMSPVENISIGSITAEKILRVPWMYILSVFKNDGTIAAIGITLVFILSVLIFIKKRPLFYPLNPPLLLIGATLFLSIFKNGEFYEYYFLLIQPLFVLVAAHLLGASWGLAKSAPQRMVVIGCVLLFILLFSGGLNLFKEQFEYKRSAMLAKQLLKDYPDQQVPGLSLIKDGVPPDSNWENPRVWYFWESILHRKFLRVVPYGNNLEEIDLSPKHRFFVCEGFVQKQKLSACLRSLLSVYSGYIVNSSTHYNFYGKSYEVFLATKN